MNLRMFACLIFGHTPFPKLIKGSWKTVDHPAGEYRTYRVRMICDTCGKFIGNEERNTMGMKHWDYMIKENWTIRKPQGRAIFDTHTDGP